MTSFVCTPASLNSSDCVRHLFLTMVVRTVYAFFFVVHVRSRARDALDLSSLQLVFQSETVIRMSDPTDPDPGWENWLRPNFKKVVDALAQLDDNAIFDKLLAGKLLTFSHYEDILRQRKAASSIEDIVRNALLRVVKKPASTAV